MKNIKGIRANARGDWYRIQAATTEADATEASGPVQVLIYGEIGDSWWGDSIPASQFVRDLAAVDSDAELKIHVHSPGGDVFDGLAIANAIRTHEGKTTVYVDGLAASAASYIAIAADETVMGVGAELMIHDAWGFAMGNAADMQKMAGDLVHVSENIASLYALKAGGTAADWREAMLAETWYTADEAVEAGLADRVAAKEEAQVSEKTKNAFDLSIFAHAGRQNAPAPRFPARNRAHKPPAPPADVPPKKGTDMALSANLDSGLRERLGISADAELDDATVLAALDEALAERAEPTTDVPAGTVLIEASVLANLQANASQGAQARAQQIAEQRGRIVDSAINDGRITPARRDHWLAALNADPEGTEQTLSGLAKGLAVPVDTQGYVGGLAEASVDDDIYARAFGKEA